MTGTQESQEYSLETLSEAVRYNRFIYTRMRPFLSRDILELGAGIGNLTPLFLEDGRKVTAIDVDDALVRIHRERVPADPRLQVECVSMQDLAARPGMEGRFSAVVSSNVLEHIPDGEVEAVASAMWTVLKPGGFAVHWVPALPGLFGSLDQAFRHFRRYDKPAAYRLFQNAGFARIACSYWNMTGIAGWWLYGKVLKRTSIPRSSALTFDKFLMPVIEVLEPRVWRPFGQSLLIVARKGDS